MSEEYSTERLLREQGSLVHTIKGVSMMPLLDQNKDAVHLIPVNRELQKNDIVLLQFAVYGDEMHCVFILVEQRHHGNALYRMHERALFSEKPLC